MTRRPNAAHVRAMADTAGMQITEETAERIANAIGPALEGFAPVSGSMAMEVEPASYTFVQRAKVMS